MLTAAHELRNLHMIICGYAQHGLNGTKPPRDCFELIKRTTERCESVIAEMIIRNNAVERAGIQESVAQVKRENLEAIDLNVIAQTAKASLDALHADDALIVKMDLQPKLPIACHGNADDLFRAVFNLCLNARAAGARKIALRTRAIIEGEKCSAWLSVQDNGRGMTRDKLIEILNIERTPQREHGRGVSIVRACVTKLGGELLGETTLGIGSVFTIVFRASYTIGRNSLTMQCC